ncbi:MAG: amino acid permease [Kiritimatiellae bacterium]|nr:amino acid permease [Kiritimatiellia bacterium]
MQQLKMNDPGSIPTSGGARPLAAHISPLAAWALAFGCAVGWGSFVMPGTTFLPQAGPLGTVLGVLIGGVVMAVIAWNYHAMMNRRPGLGGAYTYAKEAFGIDHGFLCAWFLVLAYVAIVWANATALAIVARYTLGGDVFTFGFKYTIAGYDVCMGDIVISGIAICIAAAICCRRRLAGGVQSIFAVGYALGIVLCFVAVCFKHKGGVAAMAPAYSPNGPSHIWQILRIVALSPWLFVGFEGISHASGEFKFPLRRSFGVMLAAIVTSVIAYSLLAVLPTLLPIDAANGWAAQLSQVEEKSGALVISTFATIHRALGPAGVAMIGVTMFGAIFTDLVGNIFAASRLLAAMAHDDILPSFYGRMNRDGSPRNAIVAIAAVSVLIPFLGRTAIGFIVDVSTVGAAIAYAYTSAATWRLAGADKRAKITGGLGLALSFAVLALFIVPNYASGAMMATESYLILVLWCIIGFLFFRSVFRRDGQNRFGQSTVVWIAILIIIAVMSLMWMRQTTSDTTEQVFEEVVRLHDTVLPHANEIEENHWKLDLDELHTFMNTMLLRGGLVQTGLMALAFAILFNLHSILAKREQDLIREKALRQRERDQEREKSAARSFFFSTVSHDIRTPLNAIIGFSEMLKAGFKTEAERQQAIDSIIVSGQTLLGLINDVLDLSKLESGKMNIAPEPTDCPRLLRELLDAFRVTSGKPELDLRLRVGKMPLLMLDPQRLRQIVFNLVGNAVKFTEKGHVELRAYYEREDGEEEGTFRLDVEDTGCGISEENLERIASPYVQVGSKISRHGGTGLGLAICKQLATAMGGKLEVTSTLGKGSTFSIVVSGVPASENAQEGEDLAPPCAPSGRAAPLPAAVRASGGARPELRERGALAAPLFESGGARTLASAEPSSGGARPLAAHKDAPLVRRILIVDDSRMNLMVLKALLDKAGEFEVSTASDGNEALEILRTRGADQFDLVLTDLWMPNLDGAGLVKAIRADAALASLRVIAVTADVEFRGKAREEGFDDMLLKPITMATLSTVFKGVK